MPCNVLAQGLVPHLTIPQTGNAARRGLEAGEEGRSSSWLFGARREGWRWGSTEHRCSQREKVSSLTSRAS